MILGFEPMTKTMSSRTANQSATAATYTILYILSYNVFIYIIYAHLTTSIHHLTPTLLHSTFFKQIVFPKIS